MDPVNRPQHYEDGRTLSPLAVLEDWHLDYSGGNMLKYLARWRRKNGRQDLEKMRWYANRAMERWQAMDEVKRGLLSAAQQAAVRTCTIDVNDVINDWKLCREEQTLLTGVYLAAFNGDPMLYKDVVNLLDTWLTTREVQYTDDGLRPSVYCIAEVQLDGGDLDSAHKGDLLMLMHDTEANRKLQVSLFKR